MIEVLSILSIPAAMWGMAVIAFGVTISIHQHDDGQA